MGGSSPSYDMGFSGYLKSQAQANKTKKEFVGFTVTLRPRCKRGAV